MVEGRLETIEVALLDDVAQTLVVGHRLLGERPLLLGEVGGFHLDAEAARHGHVEAELQRNDAPRLVVGRGAHMAGHGARRVEVGGAPLDEDALQGIGVVTRPELVEVRHHAIVLASATRAASLHDEVGILGADALQHLAQAHVVVHVDLRLAVAWQIGGAVVGDVAVGIPLDVGNLRVLGHQPVYHTEDEVLHLGVAEVERGLRAPSSEARLASGVLQEPVRVLVVDVAGFPVAHLRLDPDAELDAVFLGLVGQGLQPVGQLLLVDGPVAECRVVPVAVVLLAGKPSVVHHEELAANVGHALHEGLHLLLGDGQVDPLPTVEEHVARRRSVVYLVVARPVVHVAAHAAPSLMAVGECQLRRAEGDARLEVIGELVVDAGHQRVVVGVGLVRGQRQAVVATPAERGADGASVVLALLAVERQHQVGA